jgi:predicted dehydrogenase
MCPTSEEAQTLVVLAQKKNLILTVYQNRRWDADFLTVKKLIREGTVRTAEYRQHAAFGMS